MPNNMTDSTHIALSLSGISMRFKDETDHSKFALRDISLSISKGSFVSIAGPSGAGKSTLMRAILGLIPIDRGDIVRNFEHAAMVFQNYALFPWLTALENAAFGLHMEGVPRAKRNQIALEKLHEVGLMGLEHHYPAALSGGQRQRVGLARALAINPDFLILDEPFSNLDTITAENLKKDLLMIWEKYGMTILMVNHLIPDAVELSDTVIVMSAHPGQVKKVLPIALPRPRDARQGQFFKVVDELTEVIRSVS